MHHERIELGRLRRRLRLDVIFDLAKIKIGTIEITSSASRFIFTHTKIKIK